MAFSHRDGDGAWHSFDASQNEVLERAFQADAPSCRLAVGGQTFEVRFGANAVSQRMPAPPPTGMIQVNLASENTRVVRRDDRAAKRPHRSHPCRRPPCQTVRHHAPPPRRFRRRWARARRQH